MKAAHWVCVMVAVAACGGDDGNTGGSGATGDAGQSSHAGGDAATSTGDHSCQTMAQALPAGCTQADFQPYADCVESACSENYKRCYGADYLSGKFSGACATYLSCTAACSCGDASCFSACKPSTECTTCLTTDPCDTSACQEPACIFSGIGGDAGAAHTCADLTSCCNSISDASNKDECNMVVSSAQNAASQSNGVYTADSLCSQTYRAFQLAGTCN